MANIFFRTYLLIIRIITNFRESNKNGYKGMKTNMINIGLHGDEDIVDQICGHWKGDFETKQIAEYTIENGLATIHSLRPVICTRVELPFPFTVPVNDLGSGLLVSVDINCNTLRAYPATCPIAEWAYKRQNQPALTTYQQLQAEACALL